MATINPDTFQSSSNLTLWLKLRSGESLNLADIPEIVPLRWVFFRDNWADIRQRLDYQADSTYNPDYFRSVVEDLNSFISRERLSTTNPFSGSDIFYRFYPIFDSILVEEIGLTNEERGFLVNKRTKVQSFSKNDFLKIKKDVTTYRDFVADSVGLGDPDYNRIYNRATVSSQLSPTIADVNLLQVLQDQISSVDFILANLFAVDTVVDPFALARQNANNPEVNIGQYGSGYLVKLNYGEDLQGLAKRYLGNANKWIDIAIANGLREPYIDEIGEQLFLLSNGRGNQINVSADVNKFYVSQLLLIQSDTIPFPSQFHITAIREIPGSGEIVLWLDEDASLDQYLLEDNASIRIYKPNTVNSSLYVLIPSATPLANAREDEIPWFLVGAASDEKKAKIDLAIDENGSLQITPNGDIGLSYGLANAIQAVRLKLQTELGSNRFHPAYGMVNMAGTPNVKDSDVKKILIENITSQIKADARFDRVESLNVARLRTPAGPANGVAYTIDLCVRLAGSKTLLPISFTVAL